MGFLRRLLGGGTSSAVPEAPHDDPADVDAEERAHELEILSDEQERMSELARRQQRYADFAWTPPTQGGARRAEDEDRPVESG